MSESPSAPAPLSSGHLERIKQDAQRGMGASSGDTVRLVTELSLHRVALAPLPAVDYTELQARAEAANAVTGNVNLQLSITSAEGSSQEEVNAVTLFYGLATPAAFLDVIDDVGRHRAQCQSLTAQVAVLQSDANSWQSGYDVGRRMGAKLALDDRQHADRYRYLRKVTPYRFKKMQDAALTDGGDVMYFHADRFDAAVDNAMSQQVKP